MGLGAANQRNLNGDSCDIFQNIAVDPQFENADGANFHLRNESRCIAAGDFNGVPATDFDGRARPSPAMTPPDLGALESMQGGVMAAGGSLRAVPFESGLGCYPNPFNPDAVISYALPKAGEVRLTVFDLNGRQVRTLTEGWREAGAHTVRLDGRDLPSGVYFARLQGDGVSLTRKLILLK
jgi:hypothetical protein